MGFEEVFENSCMSLKFKKSKNLFVLTILSSFSMEINTCSGILWTIDDISLIDLVVIHFSRNGAFSTCFVDVDLNNVACILFLDERATSMVNFMSTLSHFFTHKCGFVN